MEHGTSAPLSATQWLTTIALASTLLWADELWKMRLRRRQPASATGRA